MRSETGKMLLLLFRDTPVRMGIPFFFCCSGYFLSRHFDEGGWWLREIRKRILSLGVPYVVWTLVLAAALLIEMHQVMGIGGFGLNLCRLPALAPLWYVRALMIFLLLSPLFKYAITRFGLVALLASFMLALSSASAFYIPGVSDEYGIGGLLCYGFPVEGLFYFLTGIYLGHVGSASPSRRQAWAALVLGCALLVLRFVLVYLHFSDSLVLRCLTTPLLLMALWHLFPAVSLSPFLRGCAFPIFVMHGVVINALRQSGGTYHTCDPWFELAMGVGLSILFATLVRRFAPRVAKVLFGGRL